jgi:hypothetical protein
MLTCPGCGRVWHPGTAVCPVCHAQLPRPQPPQQAQLPGQYHQPQQQANSLLQGCGLGAGVPLGCALGCLGLLALGFLGLVFLIALGSA